MISFNQTYDESRAIRVLVVPIGENSLYSKHFEIVSRTRTLPVFDLNRPSDWKTQNTLLKNFNWISPTANVQFDYLRYDRAASGPVDLDSFQCSRRILAIIGVINYPELDAASSSRIEQEMDYYLRRHPHVVLRRYFVFNYFTVVAQMPPGSNPPLPQLPKYDSAAKDPCAMVIFPPEGNCEGGSMIDVHTKEIMGNVAVRIIQAIEMWLIGCEEVRTKLASTSAYSSTPVSLPSWLPLKLSNDDLEEGGSNSEIARRMRRRAPGRVQKWMGDLCMQVCSPLDAWDHYNIAISECRNQNDTIWLASSLEGSVSSILLMYRMGGTVAEEISVFVKDIRSLLANVSGMSLLNALLRVCEERCVEAMNLYTKHLVYCGLEVECALRVAKMHEHLTPLPEKQQKVMDFILRAAAVPGLSVAQQIECTLEGALTCLRVGLQRKYAFLLYVAALLSADSENSYVPHSLVQTACRQYGIFLLDDGSLIASQPDCSWAGMRRMLLAHGAHFSKEHKDHVSVARYLVALLRLMGEMEANRNKNRRYWVGDQFSDELPTRDEQEKLLQTVGFQSNYAPWDPETSRAVKFIDTLNGIVLLPSKLLGSDLKFDDSTHSAPGDDTMRISRNLSSNAVSHFVESATGGISAAVRAVGVNRSMSTHTGSFHLGMMRGSITSSAGDLAGIEDRDDSQSEASEHRFTSELMTNSRGNIAVPKISPFVQNLVLKKKKHLKPITSTGTITPPAAGDIPPLMRSNPAPDTTAAVPPSSPDINSAKQPNQPQASPSVPPPLTKPSIVSAPLPLPILLDPSLRLGVPVDSQTHSLQTLMSVCTELPTATSLLLDGLPYVISLTPLPLPEEESPLPVKVSLGSKKNIPVSTPGATKALFYDPFEAKRAKSRIKSSAIHWSNEKIAQVEAIFCNPLAIPVTLHDVHLLIEGIHHSCFYAKTVIIPPDAQEFKSTFLLCPRESGKVKLIGIRFSIYNAIYTSTVDEISLRGQPALGRELSMPKKYPRTVSRETSKIPSPYIVGEIGSELFTKKEKDEKEKSPVSEILVVPQAASLSLCTSWGPDLGQTRFHDQESQFPSSMAHSQILNGGSALTSASSLMLSLHQSERRKERIRLENLSSTLAIEDFQITVHCVQVGLDKRVSYALLPFSKLRLASTVFVPPVLSQNYFYPQSADDSTSNIDPPVPFLIRLTDLNVPGCDQRILPHHFCVFDLEFVNFSGPIKSSVSYDMRIEIDYISAFSGMEKYFSVSDSQNDEMMDESETIYLRKSFISTAVTLSSNLAISSCISLCDNHIPLDLSSRIDSPSWIHSTADTNFLQAILSHFNKAYQEYRPFSSSKNLNQGQNDLFSSSASRQFSLQVDNSSSHIVTISHIPFQNSELLPSPMWDYFYPHDIHSHGSLEGFITKQLMPNTSANIIISITDEKLWQWYDLHCIKQRKSLQESIEMLLRSIRLYWLIRPNSQSHEHGLLRTGTIIYQSKDYQHISKDLLLPLLSLKFNPQIELNSIVTKIHLPARKFHHFTLEVEYFIPLLLSYFHHISVDQIVKIEIESILLILCDDSGIINKENSVNTSNLPTLNLHPLQAKNCIITGNPHQILPIELSFLDSNDKQTVQHDITCCFTKCGGYKVYTVARLLIEYLPSSSSQETTIISSSWWIPQQPTLIIAM